ncbi:DNA end-binding protein Ku [Actinacidiphila yanglinensis]|uniref:DNA end-binding protein Ku n=1 Tax=Actinacidiphila yanglinensis TaxID=310779 RepID=A0A1H6EEQ3_9ACTN|nr:Ku protein [Actinacidiphila yanglinensis]SEG95344.1 DNA end-binding protein Ku [Actinacidiphila yanglinensis]
MPPIGKFTLTFGLVAIPVSMTSATSSHKISFRQVHTEDMGRVRYRKTCELDEHVLDQEDIGRAWEAPDGRLVPISDEELDELPLPTARTIEISGFLDLGDVPGEMFGQPYFLAPSSDAAKKPYVLMRQALERSGKAAVGKYALRGSGEALGLIYAAGDILVVHRLRWPDELRSPAGAAPPADVDLDPAEVDAALEYIAAMGDLDMEQMHDEYSEAVQALIEAKVEHHAPPTPAREPAEASVTDLMGALKTAAERARADRGEDADIHHLDERRPAKKAAAKKTTGKKTAAKKTAAKKAAKNAPAKKSPRKRAG